MSQKITSPKRSRVNAARQKSDDTSGFFYFGGTSDQILLGLVLLFVFFGLLMIASAGVIYSSANFGDSYFFFKRQLFGVGLGIAGLLIFERINYHVYRRWALWIFGGAILLLIAVLLPSVGQEAYGAQRWIYLGNISFQPAEAVKLAAILYVSAWCASKGSKKIGSTLEGLVPFGLIIGLVSGLIILQPDVGTMGMIVITAVSIFYLAGAPFKHLVSMFLAGATVLFLLIREDGYRRQRLLTFLNPQDDVLGAGYQISQAAIAIGSGGLTGLGLGHSRQKALFLPEPVGDSIFAVIAEEFGLAGCLALILAFVFLGWRIYLIARRAPDLFGRLVAAGIGVWLIGQAFINMAAISGLMPLTGIPLSFISYGGTSMVFSLIAVGILLNISRQGRE